MEGRYTSRFSAVATAFVLSCTQQLATYATGDSLNKTIVVGSKTIPMSDANLKTIEKVKNVGVTVYYPTFVPARFSLRSVTTEDSLKDKKHLDYGLQFCNKQHVCFTVETAYWGIGDAPDGDKILKGKSNSLGPFEINVFLPRGKQRLYYLSNWQPDKKMQESLAKKLDVPKSEGRFYHFVGEGVTDKEAMAIVESLSPVK